MITAAQTLNPAIEIPLLRSQFVLLGTRNFIDASFAA
jgi:hypothetical protein